MLEREFKFRSHIVAQPLTDEAANPNK